MSNVFVDKTKIDNLANAISVKSGESVPMTLTEMTQAVDGIDTSGGGITPTGNIDITSAGVTDVTNYATATVPSVNYNTATDNYFYTQNGERRWHNSGYVAVQDEGWFNDSIYVMNDSYNAIASGTTVTPTTSAQTIGGANYMMEGAVTVSAMPTGTAGTPTATKGAVSNHSISVTPSVTNTTGYITGSTKTGTAVTVSASELVSGTYNVSSSGTKDVTNYASASVPSGTVTPASSISGTSATVSTGTNTLTLSKTVSNTPQVSAGYISSGTAGNSSVSLTANVTTKGAATYHPSTTAQSIAASTYLTGIQTINAVTTTNLTAANIKKDVVVKIGDSSDDDCVVSITGTYESSGGGGSGLTVATTTATLASASTSISFTGLAGEPTSFAVVSAADLATGASPWKTAAVVFDGTNLHGQTIRNTSNAQVTYDGTAFSKSYSSGTLTITGSGTNFQANQYKLVYTYGGSDISTADVQVGSGATSITFTNLDDEPSYFSCIFKSNFSTSSGYQRVITVVYDGTNTYGMEMDSSAKYSDAHWSYSYSNGSLTLSSNGTNAGGYFHQPGYYQLTYAVEGSSGNYQSKTVYATSSQQVITADSAYDALKQVTIPAVTTTNLSASNIINGVTIQVGDAADSDRIASVTGNVVLQNYYTGSSAPSSATGSNGDLYLQT